MALETKRRVVEPSEEGVEFKGFLDLINKGCKIKC